MYLLLILFVPLMGMLKFGPPIWGFGADAAGPGGNGGYLLETGTDYLLMEDGSYLLIE
jgi:hypothetical protein